MILSSSEKHYALTIYFSHFSFLIVKNYHILHHITQFLWY
jgi:hypothetical protein